MAEPLDRLDIIFHKQLVPLCYTVMLLACTMVLFEILLNYLSANAMVEECSKFVESVNLSISSHITL